ncbi:MAG: anti-sigma regulatory factor [Alphaproteobacteria bacterium]|nr:anti-sigma regulatory factor [Alphaproteobacteria bacterium]
MSAGSPDQDERVAIASDRDLNIAIADLRAWCRARGFENTETTKVITAASEIGRNILKYAGSGHMEYRSAFAGARSGIQVSAFDSGPGIADIGKALEDRYSTSGTLGLGLPGVKRLVDRFDIQSAPGQGTRVTFTILRR